jgi:hypothetical protein
MVLRVAHAFDIVTELNHRDGSVVRQDELPQNVGIVKFPSSKEVEDGKGRYKQYDWPNAYYVGGGAGSNSLRRIYAETFCSGSKVRTGHKNEEHSCDHRVRGTRNLALIDNSAPQSYDRCQSILLSASLTVDQRVVIM